MSRRPKPTAIKELEGNQGHRPLNTLEPVVPAGAPETPRYLGKSAKRIFIRKCAELLSMKVLSTVDGLALANFAKAEALGELYFRDAIKEPYCDEPIVSKEGMVVGYKRKLSQAALGFATFSKLSKGYQIEFGLTPASRSRLKVEKGAEQPPAPTREETTLPEAEVDLSMVDTTVN